MGRNPAHWLAALRRRKRAILAALLPAVALSAVSPIVCAAMLGASSATTVTIQEGHAHHGAAEGAETPTDVTPSFPPCPHCPLGSGAANAGHGICSAADDQDDGRGPKPAAASERILAVLIALPPAHAAPPPLRKAGTPRAPPPHAVPVNIRHCVLVI
jgi:hypothetical protein